MIHLKPHVFEGPFLTLFQRDLSLAFEAVYSDLCEVVNRYFMQHTKSWLSPHNVALSVYSENSCNIASFHLYYDAKNSFFANNFVSVGVSD